MELLVNSPRPFPKAFDTRRKHQTIALNAAPLRPLRNTVSRVSNVIVNGNKTCNTATFSLPLASGDKIFILTLIYEYFWHTLHFYARASTPTTSQAQCLIDTTET